MALALLTLDHRDGDRYAFRADLGANRYHRYAVGRRDVDAQDGFLVLRDVRHRSELAGPLPESALGRVRFELPAGLLDREYDTVQLWSYRTPAGDGALPSRPLRVPLSTPTGDRPGDLSAGRPALALSRPRFRPHGVSEAMFLPALAALLPALIPIVAKVLPAVLPMLGGLLGGGGGGGAAPAAPAGFNPQALLGAIGQAGVDPNTVQLLGQLLSQMSAAGPARPADPAPAVEAAPALLDVLRQVASPEVAAAAKVLPPPRVLALLLEALHQWAAAINPPAPATAAAQSLPAVPKGLGHVSRAFLATAGRLPYRRVAAVRLVAEPTPAPLLGGRPQVVVAADRPVAWRFRLDTPRPVPAGELCLDGKHPVTLAPYFSKRAAAAGTPGGPLDPVTLTPGDLAAVPAGGEFVLTATLTWKGKGGGGYGTSVTLLARKAAPLLFDRLGAAGATAALSDPQRHRDFWHKVWEAGLDRQVRRYALDLTYTYALVADRPANTRTATAWSADGGRGRGQEGRADSGLEVAVAALNALLPLDGGDGPWPADRLGPLGSAEFAAEAHRQARRRVEVEGRAGDTVAVWVYPEVQAHEVVLGRPAEPTADGFVPGLAAETARFPLPVAAHFVGVGTAS